jgi:hypothetical protein
LYCFEHEKLRIVCPVAEREFQGHVDIVTPYGFSGFVGTGDCADLPQYWREFVRERGYVCGYIGQNPIFENNSYFDANDLYSYNEIYVLDLRRTEEALLAAMSTGRKGQLKYWKKTAARLLLEKHSLRDFFFARYSDFFREKGATSAYAFSMDTVESLFAMGNVVAVGAGRPGEVEAIALFAYTPYVADYLFNLSHPEGRHHSAALIWWGVNYFKSIGVPMLNLGGGVRAGDTLAKFKERFGGTRLTLSCLKQVYDARLYNELCSRVGADPTDRRGYFPAYRSPMPS